MLAIGEILVSEELNEEFFICDLSRCKGACCVEGDLGAPLEDEEKAILEENYSKIKPYLRPEGKKAIADQGIWVTEEDGTFGTPLVEGRECAYAIFDEQGIAQCGIEKAWAEGKTAFRKPISCHLYPIRVKKTRFMEALNYDRWDICSPACSKGLKAGVRVYEFLKAAIVRKYGQEFYDQLDALFTARREATQPNL